MLSILFSHSFCMIFIVSLLILTTKGSLGATFTIINRCDYTIWPGILANAGHSRLDSTGFVLPPGGIRSFQAEPGWSGRFWGRTDCQFDPTTGLGSCATGDCGSNQVECNGAGATPPATLAEFAIGSNAQDFYDVSLVDGYNLPMIVEPTGGSGGCGLTGCMTDLNRMCPKELRAGNGQACKSACEAFGRPEYCCSGAFGSPSTCQPSVYSEMFKNVCPRSYSYAYDDATSIYTCSGADYTITFCPSQTSQKSSRDSSTPTTAATTTTTTNGLPPPVADTNTADGLASQPQDHLPAWLTNFVNGGTSKYSLEYSNLMANFAAIIFFTLSFL